MQRGAPGGEDAAAAAACRAANARLRVVFSHISLDFIKFSVLRNLTFHCSSYTEDISTG